MFYQAYFNWMQNIVCSPHLFGFKSGWEYSRLPKDYLNPIFNHIQCGLVDPVRWCEQDMVIILLLHVEWEEFHFATQQIPDCKFDIAVSNPANQSVHLGLPGNLIAMIECHRRFSDENWREHFRSHREDGDRYRRVARPGSDFCRGAFRRRREGGSGRAQRGKARRCD